MTKYRYLRPGDQVPLYNLLEQDCKGIFTVPREWNSHLPKVPCLELATAKG